MGANGGEIGECQGEMDERQIGIGECQSEIGECQVEIGECQGEIGECDGMDSKIWIFQIGRWLLRQPLKLFLGWFYDLHKRSRPLS